MPWAHQGEGQRGAPKRVPLLCVPSARSSINFLICAPRRMAKPARRSMRREGGRKSTQNAKRFCTRFILSCILVVSSEVKMVQRTGGFRYMCLAAVRVTDSVQTHEDDSGEGRKSGSLMGRAHAPRTPTRDRRDWRSAAGVFDKVKTGYIQS